MVSRSPRKRRAVVVVPMPWSTEFWIARTKIASLAARMRISGTAITLLKDINPNGAGGSDPNSLTVFNNKLYFVASDPTNGWQQLWTTDGTAAGTHQISGNQNGAFPNSFVIVGNQLFYKGFDSVHSYALLPIGYPIGRFGPVRRVPLAEVVYQDRWGQSYSP